jgi:predicted amidohydrolase YtcJ
MVHWVHIQKALLFKPYCNDSKNNTGLLVTPIHHLYNWTLQADKAGLQVSIHAIGDKANNLILDIYSNITKENGKKDRRFRIEHSQQLIDSDRVKLYQNNIIASMQPYHLMDDGIWAEKLLGKERINDLFVFKSLLNNKTMLAFGSDWPVSSPSAIMGLYAAVTRRTLDEKNPNGWIPEQKIKIEDALKSYTYQAAYASFDEDKKGILKKGYLADFIILNCDLFQIKQEEIKNCTIVKTIIDGKIVYQQ